MRVTRRDILPTMPKAAFAAVPAALAVPGTRGPVSSSLAR